MRKPNADGSTPYGVHRCVLRAKRRGWKLSEASSLSHLSLPKGREPRPPPRTPTPPPHRRKRNVDRPFIMEAGLPTLQQGRTNPLARDASLGLKFTLTPSRKNETKCFFNSGRTRGWYGRHGRWDADDTYSRQQCMGDRGMAALCCCSEGRSRRNAPFQHMARNELTDYAAGCLDKRRA